MLPVRPNFDGAVGCFIAGGHHKIFFAEIISGRKLEHILSGFMVEAVVHYDFMTSYTFWVKSLKLKGLGIKDKLSMSVNSPFKMSSE